MNHLLKTGLTSYLSILATIALVPANIANAATYDPDNALDIVNVSTWSAVEDTKLAGLRGGFLLPNGLVVNISFDKRILQNGEEIFHSYFQLPENINLTTAGELDLDSANVFDSSTIQSVIQNTLDNQTISSINNINIDIRNLNNAAQSFNTFNNNNFYTQFVLPNIPQ